MKIKKYEYNQYKIVKNNYSFLLENSSEKKFKKQFNLEEKKLFSLFLNYGFISFESENFSITSSQIIDFYFYTKNDILKDLSEEKYYSILKLPKIYVEKIPLINCKNIFCSKNFKIDFFWQDREEQSIVSTPIKLNLEGLELLNNDNQILGTIKPEYYKIYEQIENLNNSWKNKKLEEKKSDIKNFIEDCKKCSIQISNELLQYAN